MSLEHLEKLADWLDSRFVVPGTSLRFGLDSVIGLIPGVGDTLMLAISSYIIGRARRHGVPKHVQARMIFNAGIDWLIGLIPFVGDVFDIGWKANRRNLALIRKHGVTQAVNKRHIAAGPPVEHRPDLLQP